VKKKLNKPEIDSHRRGMQKPAKWVYSKSGGAMGDQDMERMEDFLQSGSGVDETVEDVGASPNEKFLNTNEERFNRKGQDDGPGRVVFGNYEDMKFPSDKNLPDR
jgi:hypothetical protein